MLRFEEGARLADMMDSEPIIRDALQLVGDETLRDSSASPTIISNHITRMLLTPGVERNIAKGHALELAVVWHLLQRSLCVGPAASASRGVPLLDLVGAFLPREVLQPLARQPGLSQLRVFQLHGVRQSRGDDEPASFHALFDGARPRPHVLVHNVDEYGGPDIMFWAFQPPTSWSGLPADVLDSSFRLVMLQLKASSQARSLKDMLIYMLRRCIQPIPILLEQLRDSA